MKKTLLCLAIGLSLCLAVSCGAKGSSSKYRGYADATREEIESGSIPISYDDLSEEAKRRFEEDEAQSRQDFMSSAIRADMEGDAKMQEAIDAIAGRKKKTE